MNNSLKKLKKEAQGIRLSSRERAVLRARIFGVPSAEATPSPYVYHYRWLSIRFAVPTAALLVVALGGGTVYAAQGSLPGDTLYSVKVNVSEPVREVLALSQSAKAEFHTAVVKTRLEEAETLVAKGQLSASSTKTLEDNLQKHIAAAEAITETLSTEDPEGAEEAATTLDSSLAAHSAVLARMGDESEDSDTREHSAQLALAVRPVSRQLARTHSDTSTVEANDTTRAVVETATTQTLSLSLPQGEDDEQDNVVNMAAKFAPAPAATSAEAVGQEGETEKQEIGNKNSDRLSGRARMQFADLKRQFAKVRDKLGTSTAAELEARLQAVGELIEEGESTQALRDSIELSTFIKAGDTFDGRLLEKLLDNRGERDDQHSRRDD